MNSNLKNIYYLNGFAYYKLKNYVGCIKEWEKYVEIYPERREYMSYRLGVCYADAGNWAMAKK